MNQVVLAMDIGGTNMRAAIVDRQGCILEQSRQPSDFAHLPIDDPEATNQIIIDQICAFISTMINQHSPINQVSIGFPGFIRSNSNVLLASPNIPTLIHYPLADAINRQSGLAVSIQNDGLCAAVGEFYFGIGAQISANSLFHITLGTGIGAGLVLQGKPYAGETGMALEFGHIKIESAGRTCGCGSRGCLETRASATAIIKDYELCTGRKCQAEAIFQYAAGGQKTALKIIKQAGWYLGLGIAQAATLLDIRHYSISGGLANAWRLLKPAIQEALVENLSPAQRSQITIHQSLCMDDAGILGAAVLAFHFEQIEPIYNR